MRDIPNDKLYTDVKFNRDKNRIKRIIRKWAKALGLLTWQNVRFNYSREPLKSMEGRGAFAECSVMWEYLRAVVTFDMLAIEDLDDGGLEYVVVHELCHILVAEMAGPRSSREREERVVTNLAMSFMDVEIMGIGVGKRIGNPNKRRKK